ncbi:MAG: hypothetical protein WBA93_32370 [Microcoleaceae cyanobacterium]
MSNQTPEAPKFQILKGKVYGEFCQSEFNDNIVIFRYGDYRSLKIAKLSRKEQAIRLVKFLNFVMRLVQS